jgi:hypothetical protein
MLFHPEGRGAELPRPQHAPRRRPWCRIDNVDDALTHGYILALVLFSQGTMLAKADIMIFLVVLARDGDHLLVDLVVKGEQILEHHVQEMRQTSGLSCVLVMNCTKRKHLCVDALVASCLVLTK